MKEWSLDILYKGYDDPEFTQDLDKLTNLINEIKEYSKSLTRDDEVKTLCTMMDLLERLQLLEYPLFVYVNLRQSTDTTDVETSNYQTRLMALTASISKAISIFNRYIAETEALDAYIEENEQLHAYAYLLKSTKRDAKYQLSDEVEDVISKMDLNAGSAWSNLREFVTSTMNVVYRGEDSNLSAVRNLAYDGDPQVRKDAYEAELASYEQVKDSIAFALNSIKGQANTISELRGYTSPLDMTLHQSRMKKDTLDAMFTAMKEYFPKFHAYLKQKAKLLGHANGLPWYDLFAPLGENHKRYSIDEAKQYLLDHFRPFADDMADMMERAFDESWIDFYPKKGKVGGAFCENLPFVKQSRVLTNYDGSLGDIVTLAHELGHAYHGLMIEDHRPLNWDYSMPVAETASTFNENIIMNAAIDAADHDEKIVLIETQLQDLTQIMCDIYSRFLFEQEVFERRKNEFLNAEELKNIMLEAQKEAYGDGLDPEYLHPYMWINKSHYYSADLNFYNFPYAFGGLFARGLVVKYQEMGDAFVDKYREMLKATTVMDVEEVADIMDIDLTDINFWRSALDTAAKRIDEFLELTK